MSSIDQTCAGCCNHLSARPPVEAHVIRSHLRRFRRNLRSVEAAGWGHLTAPCSPALPVDPSLPSYGNCCVELRKWHGCFGSGVSLTPSVGSRNEADEQDQNPIARAINEFQVNTNASNSIHHDTLHRRPTQQSYNTPTGLYFGVQVTPTSSALSSLQSVSSPSQTPPSFLLVSDDSADDEGVGSRQPNAAAIVPLASFRQGSEPPNTDDPGDHEATEATGRLTSRKRPLGRMERGEYQPSEDSAADSAWTRKRLRSRAGGVVDVSQTQHKNGGSPQNAMHKRRQMQNGRSKRRMSPRVGRKRTEPLAVLVNRIGHIDMTRQMHKAVHVMTARPTRPVPLIRVFRHSHLMLSNPEPARLVNLVPDFAQELEDSAVHQEISRFHNRLALVNFYDGYRAAQAKPDEILREADRIYPRNQNRPRVRNWTKRAEVKQRVIDLVLRRLGRSQNQNSDSQRVNN